MKRKTLLLMFMSFSLYAIYAQTSTSNSVKRNNEDYLPGNSYGLGLTIPPISTPEDPPATTVIKVTADISISFGSGTTREPACKNYYILDIPVKITVPEGQRKVMVAYKIVGMDDNNLLLQSGLVEDNQQFIATVDPGTTKTVSLSLNIYYPYTLAKVDGQWKKVFKEIKTSVTARIIAASIPTTIPHTLFLIEDPVPDNNKVSTKHLSPIPKFENCLLDPNKTN